MSGLQLIDVLAERRAHASAYAETLCLNPEVNEPLLELRRMIVDALQGGPTDDASWHLTRAISDLVDSRILGGRQRQAEPTSKTYEVSRIMSDAMRNKDSCGTWLLTEAIVDLIDSRIDLVRASK